MTLIELVIVLMVITILLGAVYLVFDQSTKTLFKEQSRVEIQQSMRQALLKIEQDFRHSNQSSIPEIEENGCYHINFQEYCLDDLTNVLYRNNIVLVQDIKQFTIENEDDKYAIIGLTSTEDKYDQTITIETRTTIRGKRDENKIPTTP